MGSGLNYGYLASLEQRLAAPLGIGQRRTQRAVPIGWTRNRADVVVESIELFEELGVGMTPELKPPAVKMPFEGLSQRDYAQKMIDEYEVAGVPAREVFAQSFSLDDVLYWIDNEPKFGRQAVFLESRYGTDVNDPDGDDVTVTWNTQAGTISPREGETVTWSSQGVRPGSGPVTARVSDGYGGTADYDADGLVTVEPEIVFDTPAFSDETLAAVGRQQSVENSTAVFEDRAYFANSAGRVVGVDISRLPDGGADIASIARGIGVKFVETIDPYQVEDMVALLVTTWPAVMVMT